MAKGKSVVDRFWEKVDRFGPVHPTLQSRCWNWSGGKNTTGYGQFWFEVDHILVHRLSWIWRFGDVPDGLYVLHRCDNRACVRSDHLFLGTYKDNAQDREAKGRGADRKGEKHGRALLSETDVIDIYTRCKNGERQIDVAASYGVAQITISNIMTKRHWRHVTDELDKDK